MIDALIGIAGLKPEEIAFFTQRDSYGDACFTLAMDARAIKADSPIAGTRLVTLTSLGQAKFSDSANR